MTIILCGYKSCGKSTLAKAYGQRFDCPYLDTDALMLQSFRAAHNPTAKLSDMYHTLGEKSFRGHEAHTVTNIKPHMASMIATGGGTMLDQNNIKHLKSLGPIIYLYAAKNTLYTRIMQAKQLPSFIDPNKAPSQLHQYLHSRDTLYQSIADAVIDTTHRSIDDITILLHQQRSTHGQ